MNKNIKISIGIIVIAVAVLLVQYGINSSSEKNTIKIGFIGHLSGDYASYSIPLQKAVELAVKETNEAGGIINQKLELISEDDGSKSDASASAINKLININRVNYIISAQGSGATAAVAPIAEANKKILMITLGSAPKLTENKNYVFRSIPSDTYQAGEMVNLIDKIGAKKVSGLYVNEAYGIGIRDIINKNQETQNANSEIFEPGAGDFRTQLAKIKSGGADTLILVARANEFPIILRQMKELKFNPKIIASEIFKDQNVLSNSGSHADGVYTTFMAEQEDFLNFTEKYKNEFNENPSAYGKYAYDGALVLFEAIKNGKNNTENVKRFLTQVDFNGASGRVGFDQQRDRIGVLYDVYLVKNEEFVKYE